MVNAESINSWLTQSIREISKTFREGIIEREVGNEHSEFSENDNPSYRNLWERVK